MSAFLAQAAGNGGLSGYAVAFLFAILAGLIWRSMDSTRTEQEKQRQAAHDLRDALGATHLKVTVLERDVEHLTEKVDLNNRLASIEAHLAELAKSRKE
jgi:uncharacterized protein YlxW (UPF0749 family)